MANLPHFGEAYLLDVIGRPARHRGFLFVAALLDGPTGPRGHRLGGRFERPRGDPVRGDEALWVRARIGRVFGVAPPTPLGKHCLLDAAFLAVRLPRSGPPLVAYPFVCTDSDGEPPVDYEYFDESVGLAFGRTDPPPPATAARIASAFWGLLLAAPDDLATFGDYYESHDGDRARVGCDGLRVDFEYLDVGPDGDGDGDAPAGPAAALEFRGLWPCPDCGGDGVEFFADLVEQPCETCRGTGTAP